MHASDFPDDRVADRRIRDLRMYLRRSVERLTGRPARDSDTELFQGLIQLYDVEPGEIANQYVDPYLERRGRDLDILQRRYDRDSRAHEILWTPESLLLFERLEAAPDKVQRLWKRQGRVDLDLVAAILGLGV
jgi:hypothetical protein